MSSNLTLPSVDLNKTGIELGVFFLFALTGEFLLFEQVNGNLRRVRQFLMNRQFNLIKNPRVIGCVNGFLKVVCYLFMFLPIITLAVWAAAMTILAGKEDRKPVGGIAIVLVGMAFNFFVYSVFKIRWQNYRLSKQTIVCMLIAFILFVSY